MKASEFPVRVELADGKPHIVDLDPNEELISKEGRDGMFWVLPVYEDGFSSEMTWTEKLARRLRDAGAMKKACTVRIQRIGEGFDTDYKIKVME